MGAVARSALTKNLIRLLPVQDRKDEGSEDLLVRSSVHADDRTGEATAAAKRREEAKTLAQLDYFWRGQ